VLRLDLKGNELKMLSELIKNSRRSDRELAKALGTSQPTATRIRTKLEKEGYVKEYTVIPNLGKLGFTILAMTFLKLDIKRSLIRTDLARFREIHYDILSKNNGSIIFVRPGRGLGYDAVVLSLHSDYASCDNFQTFIRQNMSQSLIDLTTFLMNLREEKNSLPFSFSLLANQVLNLQEEEKSR
jgi:DNA-binding Lrp family transcriptional regulator